MTLPPMEDLSVHRYDLLKLRMTSAEPLAPLYGAIQGALESRHRVWLVGGLLFPPAGHVPPVLPPAPGLPTGWSDGPYTIGWALQTGYFVQTHAERLAVVRIPVAGPVDRKSTRLNSSHTVISYAVFCLKKKKKNTKT